MIICINFNDQIRISKAKEKMQMIFVFLVLFIDTVKKMFFSHSSHLCLTLLLPHGLQLTRFLCQWNSPGKNTGVGSHSLLQGIFWTQGQNSGLLHCRHSLLSEPPCLVLLIDIIKLLSNFWFLASFQQKLLFAQDSLF